MLEPVQFADWAAPIVPVLKSDKKSVRICGDFSVTVNQVSRLDSYPLPKPEDLFARLAGGKTFSILDLSQAYLQIELDEESRKFVAINTHKGLFQFPKVCCNQYSQGSFSVHQVTLWCFFRSRYISTNHGSTVARYSSCNGLH